MEDNFKNIVIVHQLSDFEFYIPTWDVKYLFLGTFNPMGGEKVNYFYGRQKNQTWGIISKIFADEFNPETPDDFFSKLIKHRIGCMDLIHSIELNVRNNDSEKIDGMDEIIGKGYSDSKIINEKVKRTYNTEKILNFIRDKQDIKVFSTWGKGSNLLEWRHEVEKIPGIIQLVSPSRAARVPMGCKKNEFILNDWGTKII